MRKLWSKSAVKGIAMAAGLAFAGLGAVAQAQTPPPPVVVAPVADSATSAADPATAPGAANATKPATVVNDTPTAPLANIGQPTLGQYGLQPQVTRNGVFAAWMHDAILVPLITVISLFVLALILWVMFRYRRAANPIPSKTSHNTAIEIIWTLAPVIILVLIAVPSIGLLQAQFKPAPPGAVTLKAVGNQWYWSYQYPDHGGFEMTANMLKEKGDVPATERSRTDADGPRLLAADNRVVLPVGVPIRLITTAQDVIHSWAVPAFWIKLDAVPGRLNETSFTIEKPGVYFGQCSELCGTRHAFMPIAVEAVSPAEFAAWVRSKGGTMPTPGKASSSVIPQPGADGSAAKQAENAEANATGPTENATIAAPTTTQGATGNPGGTGNAGQ